MQVTGRIVVYPQRTEFLMGYGIWRDPRAASSVWPCIAPNGSTIYQFSQKPIAKKIKPILPSSQLKTNNHLCYITGVLTD